MLPIKQTRIVNVIFCLHLRNIDLCKIAESIVKQSYGVLIMIGRLVPQYHADQFQSVSLRAGYHAVAGRVGVTCLHAHQIVIAVGLSRQQLYLGIFQLFIGHMVVGQDMQPRGETDPAQHLIGKKSLADHRQIVGGGIVFLIRQAVGIDKMRVHTSQLLSSPIHDVREVMPAGAGDMLRHRKGHFVGGTNQYGIQTVLHRKLLPHIHRDMIAVRGRVIDRLPGESDPFVHGAPLRRDQRGQDLGSTGRILPGVYIFGVQHRARLRLNQNG